MSRLNNVIKQVKNSRMGKNKAWIYDDEGKIKDDVFCCEALDILEELKEYEINVSDNWIEDFLEKSDGDNTYNWGANISNDLNMNYIKNKETDVIMVFMVHLCGDIRGGYSDYFVAKFDNIYDFYEMESLSQTKAINEYLVADLNALSETYTVYNCDNGEDIGTFYDIELSDLLESIKNIAE